MSFHYYGLISSLPFLSNDFNLNRLPISGSVLRSRLRGLSLEDQEQLGAMINFHEQLYSITSYSDSQVVQLIEEVRRQLIHPQLQNLLESDVNILVVVSALRQRLANKEPILPSGEVAAHIRRNWQHPDFSLAGRFQWLPEVREHLEQGQVLELERRVDQVRWQCFVDLVQMEPFTFEAVAAYLGKWDILRRWSQVDAVAGQERFDQLVNEVLQVT
ncbi:hypothetical protein DO97_20220 [Neosynechococcus sphagnicola sy1]|uniref:DUF2764 domain-containing protein n=1 Tax=Neosynechococcus sphagnicola sy1 TaxID=1497020 RepID=A0A098TRI1_9CYAN|nr:DUF2764 family protein [Neosynechococcus sphagnicola]KGF73408.1 hypothetical protein DO97_20220 [Neosynechococcus sphagnicola sy1]